MDTEKQPQMMELDNDHPVTGIQAVTLNEPRLSVLESGEQCGVLDDDGLGGRPSTKDTRIELLEQEQSDTPAAS